MASSNLVTLLEKFKEKLDAVYSKGTLRNISELKPKAKKIASAYQKYVEDCLPKIVKSLKSDGRSGTLTTIETEACRRFNADLNDRFCGPNFKEPSGNLKSLYDFYISRSIYQVFEKALRTISSYPDPHRPESGPARSDSSGRRGNVRETASRPIHQPLHPQTAGTKHTKLQPGQPGGSPNHHGKYAEAEHMLFWPEHQMNHVKPTVVHSVETAPRPCGNCERLEADLKKCENQKEKLKQYQERIQEKDEYIRQLRNDNSNLTKQLASDLEKKIGSNEEDLENINRSNRPMKIADEYNHFCSQEWLDAKAELDEQFPDMIEEAKLRILSALLEKSYMAMEAKSESFLNKAKVDIQSAFEESFQASPKNLPQPDGQLQKVLQDLQTSLRIYLRDQCSESLQTEVIAKELIEAFQKNSKKVYPQFAEKEYAVKTKIFVYVANAVQLCWRMVTQVPPMKLDFTNGVGNKHNDKIQDVAWGSGDPNKSENVVIFFVHPPLYHRAHLMARGKVFCGKKT